MVAIISSKVHLDCQGSTIMSSGPPIRTSLFSLSKLLLYSGKGRVGEGGEGLMIGFTTVGQK